MNLQSRFLPHSLHTQPGGGWAGVVESPSLLFDPKTLLPVTVCPLSSSAGPGASEPALASPLLSRFRFENGGEFASELEDGDDPAAYVTNLSYYHLVPFETDILD